MARRDQGSGGSQPEGWEPAKLAIQEFSGWVKNADSKLTVVAAAFGVSLTLGIPQIGPATGRMLSIGGCATEIWFAILLGFVGATVYIATGIYMALVPRTRPAGVNRFSWPDHASGVVVAANLHQSAELSVDEAWRQAGVLAQIAAEKFTWLRRTLIAFGAYLVLLALLLGGAAIAVAPVAT